MLQTKEIEYLIDGQVHCGYLAYDDKNKKNLPGILIAPDWSGRGEAACKRAEELASLGYVAFALDMYGQAKTGKNKTECEALMQPIMKHRPLVAKKMKAALETFRSLPQVDSSKIAAIGYCFGGLCVLDLARTGADIKGVVSFHGLLNAPDISLCTKISAKILVQHGYDDPMATPADVNAFAAEMNRYKANWEINMYGNTKHAFTNPNAKEPELGLEYNAQTAKRSFDNMLSFFKEIF